MTTVHCTYAGDLHCQACHGPSGAQLETDAPVDNQGRGAAFSPTDLVGTALVSCILTVMGIVARRHGLALEGASARVEKTMSGSGVRRIAGLEVWLQLPAALEPDQRALLIHAGETCPVKVSIENGIPIILHWN